MNAEVAAGRSEAIHHWQFERDGFAIRAAVLTSGECDDLSNPLTALFQQKQSAAIKRIGGVRNLLRQSESVARIASSARLRSLLADADARNPFPVRAIFFDKTPERNWLVPWHQDLAIAVLKKVETPGFHGWSVKDGVVHVHPPVEILETMVTLRLHLDDCGAGNGALRVIPRSHCLGKLSACDISECVHGTEPVACEIQRGSVLLMRPLLLHSSLPAEHAGHRRVLHLEYATQQLPPGLEWFCS